MGATIDLDNRRYDFLGTPVMWGMADVRQDAQRRPRNVAKATERMDVGIDDLIAVAGQDSRRPADVWVGFMKSFDMGREIGYVL